MKAWGKSWIAWTVAMGSLSVACNGGSGVKPPPEGEEGLLESVGDRRVSALVGARGQALLLEGSARVTVPRGALSREERIRVHMADTKDLAPIPRQFEVLGEPVVVTPHGLRMDRRARVMLTVKDQETPDERLGMLRLSDEDDETWSEMKGVTRVAANTPEAESDGYRRAEDEDSLESRRRMYAMVDTFSVFLAVRRMTGICAEKAEGDVCRPSAGACDVAEVCDGQSVECPEDTLLEAGTVCAEEATCVSEAVCSGETAECPAGAPMPSGTACDDGLFCTVTDACDGEGACAGSGDPCSEHVEDGDDDCSESCVEADGEFACTGDDVDGTTCTAGSTCEAHECMAGSCEQVAACPVFVDGKAGEDVDGCGADWATACATLQRGSDRAVEEANPRVFVASGTYVPASETQHVLEMAEGVSYYGSFQGTELQVAERVDLENEVVSSSVLDGQLATVSIVRGASDARLDGFKITGGSGFEGAGMYNAASENLTVANAYFYENSTYNAGARGAGMFNALVTGLRVQNVTFENNALGDGSNLRGGAMFNEGGSDLQIVDSVFVANSVSGDSSAGGALYNDAVSGLKLTRVVFADNELSGSVELRGGAMVSVDSTQLLQDVRFEGSIVQGSAEILGGALADLDTQSELKNVEFRGNVAVAEIGFAAGGGAYAVRGSTGMQTRLDGVLFSGNGAMGTAVAARGGAMFVDANSEGSDSLLRIADSRFENNTVDTSGTDDGVAALGGGLCAIGDRLDVNLTRVRFDSNAAYAGYDAEGSGGGLYSVAREASVVDSTFLSNEVNGGANFGVAGGGAYFASGPFTAKRVQFLDNRLLGDSVETRAAFGAGLASSSSAMTLRDCDFIGNEASVLNGEGALGGGLGHEGGTATVVNTGFYANSAMLGGGAWLDGASGFDVTNASFVNNYASQGLNVYAQNGTGAIRNTATLADEGDGIASDSSIALTIEANCASNTLADFETVASRHVFLAPESACLDTGEDSFADAAFTGAAWNTLSTRTDNMPDVTPVDSGRHYRAEQVRIMEFADDGDGLVRWTVEGPDSTRCELILRSLETTYEIPEALTASGTYDASAAGEGGDVTLVCTDGGQSAVSYLGYESDTGGELVGTPG